MKLEKIEDLNWKSFTILTSIICYWVYLNICFGYLLSRTFFDFFEKWNLSKSIKLRENFSIKNFKKFIQKSFWKFFEDWFIRISQKFLLFLQAIKGLFKGIIIFRKKFKILKVKRNFRLLKILLGLVFELILVYWSLVKEIFFVYNFIKWVIDWFNLIEFLIKDSVVITRLVYLLYLILLGLFSLLLGFLLGIWKRHDQTYLLMLLLLLKMFYTHGLDLEYLLLDPEEAEQFSKFSFKTVEQINPRPLKIILKEQIHDSRIPLPILSDQSLSIDITLICEECETYKFELFTFYHTLSEKIKH